ncbi:MAG: hypothetical protein QOG76_5724 [Pseudonocardiales bacterium]|nr:hypothetical protein [Pseudonocardiales bacterium]
MSSDLRSASSPTKPGDVTSEWWAGVLAQRGITQGVAGVGCEPVGHGMLCDTFRFEVTYDEPRSPDAPDSFIVKFAAVDPGSRTTGFKSLMYEREAGFYRDIAHTLEVRAPRSYHVSIDTETQTMAIVMEDLAPARPGDQLAGCGCIGGAAPLDDVKAMLTKAGFTSIEITVAPNSAEIVESWMPGVSKLIASAAIEARRGAEKAACCPPSCCA